MWSRLTDRNSDDGTLAMQKKVDENRTPILLRDKLLVLGIINTLQPVKQESVVSALSSDLAGKRVDMVLDILRRDRMIRNIGDANLVVSYQGRKVFGSKSIARARDISRMLYLAEKSKGGGGKS